MRPELALLGVTLLWGASFTVIKDALDVVPPHLLVALRFGIAAFVLALLSPRRVLQPAPGARRAALVLGVLLWGGYAFQTWGLTFTTPSRSAFITSTAVLLVPGVALLALRVRPTRGVGFGVLLATGGLWFLTQPGSGGFGRGESLTAFCALSYAAHIVALGHLAPNFRSLPLATLQLGVVAACATGATLAFEQPSLDLPFRAWLAVGFLGVFCSAVAVLVQTWAQRRIPAARAGLLFALEPVFAALIAWIALGEGLTPVELLGGALVVVGVAVAEGLDRGESRKALERGHFPSHAG
ncbi:MAG: DMT family transporter [Myxococcales bacterium]|nr:DMT family transporter [Myxococcales bacterium]